MSRDAHFRVEARFDAAGGKQEGTVTVDRDAGLVHVRPLRAQRVYTMPLDMVADMICQRIVLNEVRDQKIAKKAARKARG